MKGLKKIRWGVIALVIALVLAPGLTLTGCDNDAGPSRGFDPVGTWRGTEPDTWHDHDGSMVHSRSEYTLTLWANGTGTMKQERFLNDIFDGSDTTNVSYSVSDNIITITVHWPMGTQLGRGGEFTDNNTLIWDGMTFRRN